MLFMLSPDKGGGSAGAGGIMVDVVADSAHGRITLGDPTQRRMVPPAVADPPYLEKT